MCLNTSTTCTNSWYTFFVYHIELYTSMCLWNIDWKNTVYIKIYQNMWSKESPMVYVCNLSPEHVLSMILHVHEHRSHNGSHK